MKIKVTCSNCSKDNEFEVEELVSGMPIKNDEGIVVEEHPEVEIDENTMIQCEHCRYPISCANPTILP